MTETTETIDSAAETAVNFETLERQLHSDLHREQAEGPQPGASSKQAEGLASQSEPEPDQTVQGNSEGQTEGSESVTVAELAERLGIDAADLYEGLAIDLGDGNTVTLGQFKDRAKDLAKSEALLTEAKQHKIQLENELLRKSQALQAKIARAGIQFSDDDVQRSQQEWQQYRELQDRTLAEWVPELAKTEAVQAFESQMADLLAEYAYSEAEIPFMVDARLRKLFHDYAELRDTVNGVAKSKVRDKAPKKPNAHKSVGSNVSKLKAAVQAGKVSQDSAIKELGRLLG